METSTTKRKNPVLKGIRELTVDDFYLEADAADWDNNEGHWSYYLATSGNMDEIFGTNVETGKNDDYVNVYAFVSPDYEDIDDYLSVNLWKGNGDVIEHDYMLSEREKEVLEALILEFEIRRMTKRFNELASLLGASK